MSSRTRLMTRSSATISLFAEPSIAPRSQSSFFLSILAHAAAVGLVYFAVTHVPRIEDPSLRQRYAVRQLDLHALDPEFPQSPVEAKREFPYPGPYLNPQLPAALPPELADAMRTFLGSTAGRQTLIQPRFHTHLSFAENFPLPTIMIWTPERAFSKRIAAPLPSPPTSSPVKPSLELPNQEIHPADIGMASTALSPRIDAPPAGTTSPLVTHSANAIPMAPAAITVSLQQLATTAVLSISDLRMRDGTVMLPPVNDIAPSNGGESAAGAHGGASKSSGDNRDSAQSGTDLETVTADGRRLSTQRIVLPRDGKFGVIVVGNSLAEQYPESLEIWANRLAYTAFLHVGLKKNWILQYSATRAAEPVDAGRVARLEAPWPYDIARPNLLSRDLNADALMVHGVLNQAGRLESLVIAFPSGFRYASFVLHALRQWQFRPARQNGQPTPVEVLLIIPDEME